MHFPRSTERGPIEAIALRRDSLLTVSLPRSTKRGPIEADLNRSMATVQAAFRAQPSAAPLKLVDSPNVAFKTLLLSALNQARPH